MKALIVPTFLALIVTCCNAFYGCNKSIPTSATAFVTNKASSSLNNNNVKRDSFLSLNNDYKTMLPRVTTSTLKGSTRSTIGRKSNTNLSLWNNHNNHSDDQNDTHSSFQMNRVWSQRYKAITNTVTSLSLLFTINTFAIQNNVAPNNNFDSTGNIEKIIKNTNSKYEPILTQVNEMNVPTLFQFVKPAYASDEEVINDNQLTKVGQKKSFKEQKGTTIIDEVWELVNKYYLDQTFHDQDWSTVKQQYESQLKIVPNTGSYNDEEAMKLVTTMVQSLGDKYSRILDKEAYGRIQKFDLIGVGATLMPDSVDKRIKVGAPPVDGSEAQKAGIKYGDYIVAVNGVKTEGRTAFQIIDQISEDPDAKLITMTVLTEGPDDIKGEGYFRDVTMKRQTMEVKNPIFYKISERRSDGTVVGYIRLSEFNSLVEPRLKDALSTLKNDGANAYVLDMRSNPGGAFQSAVEIASFFMEDKIATSVVDSNSVEMPFKTGKGKVMIDSSSPLVIWIDGGSASATEVLAGALHDQCRASIMGQHSFGKGLIQAVYGLQNGGGLVLTVAKYVTPNGTDIQGSGIMPDVETKLPFLYLPNISSDTSKVDFNFMVSQNSVCPAEFNVQTS